MARRTHRCHRGEGAWYWRHAVLQAARWQHQAGCHAGGACPPSSTTSDAEHPTRSACRARQSTCQAPRSTCATLPASATRSRVRQGRDCLWSVLAHLCGWGGSMWAHCAAASQRAAGALHSLYTHTLPLYRAHNPAPHAVLRCAAQARPFRAPPRASLATRCGSPSEVSAPAGLTSSAPQFVCPSSRLRSFAAQLAAHA